MYSNVCFICKTPTSNPLEKVPQDDSCRRLWSEFCGVEVHKSFMVCNTHSRYLEDSDPRKRMRIQEPSNKLSKIKPTYISSFNMQTNDKQLSTVQMVNQNINLDPVEMLLHPNVEMYKLGNITIRRHPMTIASSTTNNFINSNPVMSVQKSVITPNWTSPNTIMQASTQNIIASLPNNLPKSLQIKPVLPTLKPAPPVAMVSQPSVLPAAFQSQANTPTNHSVITHLKASPQQQPALLTTQFHHSSTPLLQTIVQEPLLATTMTNNNQSNTYQANTIPTASMIPSNPIQYVPVPQQHSSLLSSMPIMFNQPLSHISSPIIAPQSISDTENAQISTATGHTLQMSSIISPSNTQVLLNTIENANALNRIASVTALDHQIEEHNGAIDGTVIPNNNLTIENEDLFNEFLIKLPNLNETENVLNETCNVIPKRVCAQLEIATTNGTEMYNLSCVYCDAIYQLSDWQNFTKHIDDNHPFLKQSTDAQTSTTPINFVQLVKDENESKSDDTCALSDIDGNALILNQLEQAAAYNKNEENISQTNDTVDNLNKMDENSISDDTSDKIAVVEKPKQPTTSPRTSKITFAQAFENAIKNRSLLGEYEKTIPSRKNRRTDKDKKNPNSTGDKISQIDITKCQNLGSYKIKRLFTFVNTALLGDFLEMLQSFPLIWGRCDKWIKMRSEALTQFHANFTKRYNICLPDTVLRESIDFCTKALKYFERRKELEYNWENLKLIFHLHAPKDEEDEQYRRQADEDIVDSEEFIFVLQ